MHPPVTEGKGLGLGLDGATAGSDVAWAGVSDSTSGIEGGIDIVFLGIPRCC
jgi:hypothetical protein